MQIRPSTAGDTDAIIAMYPEVFPDEDLVPVVRELLEDPPVRISLVAVIDERIVGNVIFTTCSVNEGDIRVGLLGPLAVAPDCQQQGIGSALVNDGLRWLEDADFGMACVLGDPAYYGRFGFVQEDHVEPPYPLPAGWAGAWQSQFLGDTATLTGKLVVPTQWQHAELWSE